MVPYSYFNNKMIINKNRKRPINAVILIASTLLLQDKRVECFQLPTSLKSSKWRRNIGLKSTNESSGVTSSSSSSNTAGTISRPFVTFYHPVTNTEVTLIGCLHGSTSSAKDVSNILQQKSTDVVVLELCPTRYKDLMKEVVRTRTSEKKITSGYLQMIQKTIQSRGVSTGLAAAVLGGVSSLSYLFSGFQPGYEFLTAMEYVESRQDSCDVVLADRFVDETLRRVGALPSVSLELWNEFIDSGMDWEGTYGQEMQSLFSAISGKGNLQVDMKRTLFRNIDVIKDLARLMLPTLLFVEVGNISLGLLLFQSSVSPTVDFEWTDFMLLSSSWSLSDSIFSVSDWSILAREILLEVISSGFFLLLGFLFVALPISRVILTERDEQLARGIDVACNIASRRNNDNQGGRVVAVLGMLHVNGVANRILVHEQE
mmetsp:Transcript_6806/g.12809  ORF Transcript_6806/g.12809 Transcript_6806/m.12809 type:complete len:429 (+) Transcript_6806:44-1330(+)